MPSDILGKPGFCVVPDIERADPGVIAELGEYQAAIIGDGMGRRAIMDAGIKPLNPRSAFAGSAVTVEVHPADNLMIHAAIRVAKPGDVLVINAHGSLSHGIFGELTTRMALRKGIVGVVMDGAVRDSLELTDSGLPVFTRGVNPAGGGKEGPGQVNMPTSCGGVSVSPGDIVVGDADGVIVVPAGQGREAVEAARARVEAETKRIEAIESGPLEGIYAGFLMPTLRAHGIELEDEAQ